MENLENEFSSHFTNLFRIALADNEIAPAELNLLYELGLNKGFSKEKIDEIIANPHKVRFVKPTSFFAAVEYLFDLVQMVCIDDKIHLVEIELLKSFAKRFEIPDEIIDELIEKLVEQIKLGVSKSTLINEIKQTI